MSRSRITSPSSRRRRLAAGLATASGLALMLSSSAGAHISIHPNAVPAGAFATLDVRVPGEREGAHVTKVDVLFPPGFIGVDFENVPGWHAQVIETKLAKPVVEDGASVDTQVGQIVWTWTGPLGEVANNQFIDFPLSLAIPDGDAGRSLEFRTVQTYSDGTTVHWIEPGLEDEHPSPRIDVTEKGGTLEDVAGAEAGPAPGATSKPRTNTASAASGPASSGGGSGEGIAVAALVVAVLALLAAAGGLRVALARRDA